jgi:hypothetical protein
MACEHHAGIERRIVAIEVATAGLPVVAAQVADVHRWVSAERDAREDAYRAGLQQAPAADRAGRWQFRATLTSSLLALLAAVAAAIVSLARCAP